MPTPSIAVRRIVFGLYLLLVFSLGFMKPSLDSGFASLTPTDLIFPVVFLSWLAALAGGYYRLMWRTEFLAFGFYFLSLTISSFFSVNPRLSFGRLAGAAYLILLAIVTYGVVTTDRRLRLSVLAWLAGYIVPVLAALIGIFLFYFVPESPLLPELTYHYGAVPVGNFPRISSTFISASMFCNYLTVTLVLTLASAKMKWIRAGVASVIVFTIAVSALFTVSIALGGFALATGLWLWVTNSSTRISRGSLVIGCAIAIAFLAIAPFALSVASGTSVFQEFTPSSRFLVWGDAISTFLADPLTGRGLGTPVAEVVFQNYDGTLSLLTDAHNTFLSVAAQAGIPGLLGIAAIVIVMLKAVLVGSKESEENYILLGCGIAFVAAFVYDGLTGSFEDARHLWVLMGLILSASNRAGIREEQGRSSPLHGA